MPTKIDLVKNQDGTKGETWNPVRGCSKVSDGCKNCYAERMAARFCGTNEPYDGLIKNGRWTGEVRLIEKTLAQPMRWKKPRMVFVNSMSDLFHEALSDEQIAAVFGVMMATPQHTYQILSKRPERMRDFFNKLSAEACARGPESKQESSCRIEASENTSKGIRRPRNATSENARDDGENHRREIQDDIQGCLGDMLSKNVETCIDWPLSNVWLGVSVETQATADERIPLLLSIPAADESHCCEPLLSLVDLEHSLNVHDKHGEPCGPRCNHDGSPVLSWVICGCESGTNARPMHDDWARMLRDQCQEAGIPFFLKQMMVNGKLTKMSKLDGKVWNELPSR